VALTQNDDAKDATDGKRRKDAKGPKLPTNLPQQQKGSVLN